MGILAAGIYLTAALLRATTPSPAVRRFVHVFGRPGVFRWIAGDTTADDGWTAYRPIPDDGAFILEREDDRGVDLVDDDEVLLVSQGRWRVLPAATVTAPCAKTLGTAGAARGDSITVTRLDLSAHAVTLGALTMPGGSRSWARHVFNGTAWVPRAGGLLL